MLEIKPVASTSKLLPPSVEDGTLPITPSDVVVGDSDSCNSPGDVKVGLTCLPRPVTSRGLLDFPSIAAPEEPEVDTDSNNTVLHRTCQLFPTDVSMVEAALQGYPKSIRKRAVIPVLASQLSLEALLENCSNSSRSSFYEPYTLPLHISLTHKASLQVIQCLVQAGGPGLLLEQDGVAGHTPLTLALDASPHDNDLITLLLESNPKAAEVATKLHGNLPLHFACLKGAPKPIVRQLISLYPEAQTVPNKAGRMPFDGTTKNQYQPLCDAFMSEEKSYF